MSWHVKTFIVERYQNQIPRSQNLPVYIYHNIIIIVIIIIIIIIIINVRISNLSTAQKKNKL